eukprot:CAMPEP_0197845208 /NCGR_PEP_ID=MMETSP1438-20131217/2156_1 /TAXON_ID=1461541 /ORGANISM="Pterosperma sp., Strain CCMP1384" /LENGTH=428 /DNA_ID=CAMNT_0043456395 /DNA_START=236 /DNA_END=1522 /DNA_ORIENTATION=+
MAMDHIGEPQYREVSVTPKADGTADLHISCPDATGLGTDFARLMFNFNLQIIHGDFSTDGKWCFLMFKVRSLDVTHAKWHLLKRRLETVCPNFESQLARLNQVEVPRPDKPIFLVIVDSEDRTGLLNDAVNALLEQDCAVHTVHVSTTPAGRAIDIFYITDNRDDLPSERRANTITGFLRAELGGSMNTVCTITEIPTFACKCGATFRIPLNGCDCKNVRPNDMTAQKPALWPPPGEEQAIQNSVSKQRATVTVDNSTSKAHTLLQIQARDRKGLLYDCYRAVKDVNIQVSYGKINVQGGICELDLFVQDGQGQRVRDPAVEAEMCRRLKLAIDLPVLLSIKGSDCTTELRVASTHDAGGRGRPRVLLDVTRALRKLGILCFQGYVKEDPNTGIQTQSFLLTSCSDGTPICKDEYEKIYNEVRRYLLS